jgi:MFS transporter, AAHS family, 3-hydroxyphenylpropionic acid transporter
MPPSEGLGERSTARRTLWLCFLICLCEGIDLQAAGVAAGGIRAQFHADAAHFGYFFSASTFGLFVGALVGGRLSDRVGRRSVLLASVCAFGLFSLLTPFAWDIGSLSWARLLTGLGLGGALPNVIALSSENAPASQRSASVTMIYAGMPLGGALASLIMLVSAAEHWRWVFIVGGVVPLAIAPVLGLLLPESRAFQQHRAAGAGRIFDVFADGRAARTLLLWITFLLALLALYLLLNWLPTLMIDSGLTKAQAALAQIAFNIGGALAAIYVGLHLETNLRRIGVLVVFLALPCLLGLLALAPGTVTTTLLLVFLLGASVLAAQAILYAYAPLCYPTAIRGTGVGFAVSMGRIGSIIGPLLGSVLVGSGRTPSQVLTGLLPLVLVGSACAIRLTWRAPRA